MGISQENSLYGYLKETKNDTFFSFTNLENRRAEQVLPGEVSTSERREEVGKW
jgi:hypothetical protein